MSGASGERRQSVVEAVRLGEGEREGGQPRPVTSVRPAKCSKQRANERGAVTGPCAARAQPAR